MDWSNLYARNLVDFDNEQATASLISKLLLLSIRMTMSLKNEDSYFLTYDATQIVLRQLERTVHQI